MNIHLYMRLNDITRYEKGLSAMAFRSKEEIFEIVPNVPYIYHVDIPSNEITDHFDGHCVVQKKKHDQVDHYVYLRLADKISGTEFQSLTDMMLRESLWGRLL